MSASAIGHIFDDGRSEIAPGAFHSPFGNRMNGQIVTLSTRRAGMPKYVAACCESAGAAARNALKGGNGPLVIDDIHHHRGLCRSKQKPMRRGNRFAVEPSPIHAAAIFVSWLMAEAMAQPTACVYCVARLPEMVKSFAAPVTSTSPEADGLSTGPARWRKSGFIIVTSG